MQTALAKAYVAWRRVRDVEDPEAYVARILINAHYSEQRRKRVREWFPGTVPERAVGDRAEAVADRSALMAAVLRSGTGQLRRRRATVGATFAVASVAAVATAALAAGGTTRGNASGSKTASLPDVMFEGGM